MRKTRTRLAIPLLLAPLLSGCGTMLTNLGGFSSIQGHYMEPYGGVKASLESGTECFKKAIDLQPEHRLPPEDDRWFLLLGGTYVLALDVPMCAIADTLTLPITIRATLNGEARTGPVHWGGGDKLFALVPSEKQGSSSDSSAK
jgi:uncharacterized protein YceK